MLGYLLTKKSREKDGGIRLLTKEEAYFIPLKIHGFSSADIPYLDVNIENNRITAKIDLGYDGAISAPTNIIEKLQAKTFINNVSSYGLTGKAYKSNVYEVPEIRIENMRFFPAKIEAINLELEQDIILGEGEKSLDDNVGTIGWRLFHNFNLLLDCKHSLLALCDSLMTLKQKGYPVESFTEVPLLLDRGFLEFEAKTEAGILRCVLDTGSTWNMLNKDLENSSNGHMIFTSENTSEYSTLNPENKSLLIFDHKDIKEILVFNIGEKEFGPMTFDRIKSPMAIDAIIGMEFIESTLIYVDFANHKLYFYEIPEEEILDGKTQVSSSD